MQIALTGDVMLGRLVDQYVIQNRSIGPDKIWSDVLPLLLKADRRLILIVQRISRTDSVMLQLNDGCCRNDYDS
jgi:poly-gamma-glutamate synthesis protein (capsule biosynthesis protein)